MKERIYGIITILMLTMLAACGNPLDPPERNGETGTVLISLDGVSAGARTLMPGPDEFVRYTASFSGPDAQADVPITGGALSLELGEGSWTITVTASTGAEGAYADVGRGSATVAVVRRETVAADISITPLVESGKEGVFSYSITIPAVESATLSLTNMDTNTAVNNTPIDLKTAAVDGAASDTLALDAGCYLMNIQLEQTAGGKTAGRTEAVHIYDGLTTTADYVFVNSDFNAVVDLVDGVWLDGEITKARDTQYYRFPVTAGLWYGVWVNDNGYDESAGDGTKTLQIGVAAMHEGGTESIFPSDLNMAVGTERRYIFPQLFTAASSGGFILTVAQHASLYYDETGTFAIKYGEIKPIAAGIAETGTLAAGTAQWYYFVPEPSTSYTISWEDSGDQAEDSSYTGDVVVTAFNTFRANPSGAGTRQSPAAAFDPADSGYAVPQVLKSTSISNDDRLQLIRVEAETGGTYSIKYQKQQ
jgi:hypothetical protein